MKIWMGLLLGAVVIGSAIVPPASIVSLAFADITRHCRAFYYLRVHDTELSGRKEFHFPLTHFAASGSCGLAVPNRCRIRARDRAHRCMQAHWDGRWKNVPGTGLRPTECGPGHGISGYQFTNLKEQIEITACCPFDSAIRNTSDTVSVYRVSYGDKGCGNKKIEFGEVHGDSHAAKLSDYDLNCRQIRRNFCPNP